MINTQCFIFFFVKLQLQISTNSITNLKLNYVLESICEIKLKFVFL